MSESALLLRPESPAPCRQGGELQGPLISNSDFNLKAPFKNQKRELTQQRNTSGGRDVQSCHNKNRLVFLNNVFCYGHGGHALGFLFSVSMFKMERPEMCQTFSCEHSRTLL